MIDTTPLPEGYQLVHYNQLESTNETAMELARNGSNGSNQGASLWVVADEQTKGRGSRGRDWVSLKGNLFASLVIQNPCPLRHAAELTFVAALAVMRTICQFIETSDLTTKPKVELKWPNDVLVNGEKVSGILLESQSKGNDSFVVVGIGINVAAHPSTALFPATSLTKLPLSVGRDEIFQSLALHFDEVFRLWGAGRNFDKIRSLWLEKAKGIGENVTIRPRHDSLELSGIFQDLSQDGALILKLQDGTMKTVHVADLFFV